MRLFAAVLPPPTVTDELAAATGELPALPGARGLRWTPQENWHLTLAFYGEVPEQTTDELHTRLGRAAARTTEFTLSLAGGGRFGDRVLWAGVDGDRDTCARLAARAQAAGRKAGLATPPVRYHPHLSLARPRRGERVELLPYVTALDGFRSTPWTVTELALLHSRLPNSGVPGEQPHYERVAGWPLSG